MSGVHVAIIGGGVVGAAIAWTLSEFGLRDVELFEKRRLASGSTGVCPGGLRQQFEGVADCLLARFSLEFYACLNELLSLDTPLVIERTGYLFLAESEERLAQFRRNVAVQNALGIPSELLAPSEIARVVPALRLEGVLGGSFCAEDGFLEDCHGVTYAFAMRARERGVRFSYEEVIGLDPGARWRLRTRARVLEADHVIVAAGADSAALLAPLVDLPIRGERRRLAYSTPVPPGQVNPLVAAIERGVALKQLSSGVLYMGWLGESAAADDLTFVEETLRRGATLLPMLEDLPVRRVIAGNYDNTPDRRPLLGRVPGFDGLWVAAGFSGHGFMIAPAAAEIVASAICGRQTSLPTAAFFPARFAGHQVEEGLFI